MILRILAPIPPLDREGCGVGWGGVGLATAWPLLHLEEEGGVNINGFEERERIALYVLLLFPPCCFVCIVVVFCRPLFVAKARGGTKVSENIGRQSMMLFPPLPIIHGAKFFLGEKGWLPAFATKDVYRRPCHMA